MPECQAVMVHTDVSMKTYGTTLRGSGHVAGSLGFHEVQGFWGGGHRELANITDLGLLAVRLALKVSVARCLLVTWDILQKITNNMAVMRMVRRDRVAVAGADGRAPVAARVPPPPTNYSVDSLPAVRVEPIRGPALASPPGHGLSPPPPPLYGVFVGE